MKPLNKIHWDEDDFEFEEAFIDVSNQWHSEQTRAPEVPAATDRMIRRQARQGLNDGLDRSWIWGSIPLTSLAASLFFGIGVYFVVSLEEYGLESSVPQLETVSEPSTLVTRALASTKPTTIPPTIPTTIPTTGQRALVIDPNALQQKIKQAAGPVLRPLSAEAVGESQGWVEVSFRRIDGGVVDGKIEERCVLVAGRCEDLSTYDNWVLAQLPGQAGQLEKLLSTSARVLANGREVVRIVVPKSL